MDTYSVYQVCYQDSKTVRIGRVLERRKRERHNNASDLLRLAQKIYAYSAIDSHLFIIKERTPGIPLMENEGSSSALAGRR